MRDATFDEFGIIEFAASPPVSLFEAMWLVSRGWQLERCWGGWEWMPSSALWDELLKNGEIG